MSLWKRGNVYWSYVYLKGVRYHKNTKTGNRRLAEICDLEFKKELQERLQRPAKLNPEMTFGELSALFLANGIVRPYHIDRLKILLPYFSEMPLYSITRAAAQAFRKERHRQKQITETTVNRDIETLRHFLFWAVDEGILVANPLSRVRLERERRRPHPVLSVAEELSLLAVASPHLREIIITAVDTGMRRGELLGQRWEHVDFARRLLSVTRSKTAEGEGREIPMTCRVFELLWQKRQSGGLIFTFKGRPIHAIKTSWKTAITSALKRHLRFHDLRHTFNTRLMEAGVLQEIRKALMGHSSGEDVNSIYTHVELPTKRRAIQMLEVWMAQQIELQKGGEAIIEAKHETKAMPAGTPAVLPDGARSLGSAD